MARRFRDHYLGPITYDPSGVCASAPHGGRRGFIQKKTSLHHFLVQSDWPLPFTHAAEAAPRGCETEFLFSSACERLWLRYIVYLAAPCTFPSSLARGGGPFRFQAGLGSLWKGEGLSQPQHVKYVSIFSRTYLHCMYLLCIHYIHPVARNTVRAASRSMGSIGCRLALGSDGRGRVSPNPRNTV